MAHRPPRGWCQRGQASIEHLAVVAVAVAVLTVLMNQGLVASATTVANRVGCLLFDTGPCVAVVPPDGGSRSERVAALVEAEARRAPSVARFGGQVATLASEAAAARRRGDLAASEAIGRQLDLYLALLDDTPRGRFLGGLVTPTDLEFRQLADRGSIQSGDGSSARYFAVEARPGDGLVVMDFFIRQGSSGLILAGDDRDFIDPLGSRSSLDDSRVTVIIDRESGRGVVHLSETCTVDLLNRRFCNEARPIVLDLDDRFMNDPANDLTGEGVNIDLTNRLEVDSDAEEMSFRFDMLNSVLPLFSVDGSFALVRGSEGRYGIERADRDKYPALGIYQYQDPDGQPRTVFEERGGNVGRAVPTCDLPDLPALPFGPDLPDLPAVPGPCF